jgi:FdhD protein
MLHIFELDSMAMNIKHSWQQTSKDREILRVDRDQVSASTDHLTMEEPLEIKLGFGKTAQRQYESLSITMRTPGHDFELASGFLFTEGIIHRSEDILSMRYIAEALSPESQSNILLVELHPDVKIDWESLSRHFYTSSSCGVCGKGSIEMVQTTTLYHPRPGFPRLPADLLHPLPAALRAKQQVFRQTGGIHAAALFNAAGEIQCVREDVGRHNALDKLIGLAFREASLPLKSSVLLVSGRASFELVQKALMAGIPILAAVGAPSSLAVELAEEYDMTLIGFLRNQGYNIYCGSERIQFSKEDLSL